MTDIYDPNFVESLFEKMSATYERMNLVTSFGFSVWWRQKCVATANLKRGMVVVDLMSGMGEAWRPITRQTGSEGKLVAVDFCKAMIKFAEREQTRLPGFDISILCENALQTSLPDNSADAVISTFGLKTFSPEQIWALAKETRRMLKPGGVFSMIEVSSPRPAFLRILYLFYLKNVIPVLGKLFLGNPETYRMLGIYTERFGDCSTAVDIFRQAGFEAEMKSYFFGCATGIVGKKNLPGKSPVAAEVVVAMVLKKTSKDFGGKKKEAWEVFFWGNQAQKPSTLKSLDLVHSSR